MQIATIEGATRTLGEGQGYLALPLRDVLLNDTVNGPETPAMQTAWIPDETERTKLVWGAPLILTVLGRGHPPVMLSVDGSGVAMEPALPVPDFQHRVHEWMLACFGQQIAANGMERNHRFLEEALELVQSLGCTQSEAHQLVRYVFERPVGEPMQEVGGVMVTLAALCTAHALPMLEGGNTELHRVWGKVEQIRAKQAAKPPHTPLPSIIDGSAMPRGDALIQCHDGQVQPAMFFYAIEGHDMEAIASEHGFEICFLTEEPDDWPSHPDSAAYLAAWQPEVPEGYQFGGKWHTEDGIAACFLRRREGMRP